MNFYQATWLTYIERWFKWVTAIRINLIIFEICEPLARCTKRGSSLPLGTPMEIDFTSAYLHYPLPQYKNIVTPIIFLISYELFRLPSAKFPQDYQLLRTSVWCLMEKLTRNNRPFLDTTITSNEDICGQENYEKQLQVFSIVHFSCLILVFKWLKMQLQVIRKKKKRIARVYL